MIMRTQRRDWKSAVASATAAAILITSPGPLATRAFAQLASGAAASGRAAGTVTGAAGTGIRTVSPSLSAPSVSISLTPSLALPSSRPQDLRGGTPSAQASVAVSPSVKAAPAPASAVPSAAAEAVSLKSAVGASVRSERTPEAKPASVQTMLQRMAADVSSAFKPGSASRTEKAASSLNAVFDANVRKAGAAQDVPVAGKAGRALSGLRSAQAAPVNECAGGNCGVPTPSKAKAAAKPSAWDKPIVKYGAPAAILGATAFFFSASLVPVAIISGSLMFSILAHESAHILGLRIWGDPSPKEAGRDHINPFKHIDLFGTVLLPAASLALSNAALGFPLLFGWAKPVPVDFNNLKDVQHDAAKVAALGPLTNLAIAGLAFGALWALPALGLMSAAGTGAFILSTLWKMNLALAAFNILPLPWLDGGKLLVALFSKSAYARWTANPNLPEGYQGLFRRIYEGPANILSRFNIKSLDQVNGITRVATLGALGAFYALFFTTLQFPLLFLALPCSYDYWCIREKVRSEEAVEEMMDLMSQWGAALVQIAEDHDAESEVSAYEAEHAMKNAVDQLLEDLMAKEEFRNLSDEEKVKEFMRVYPDMAAKFLKEKVLTQDSEEKIRQILADPRNAPFMARLEKWLKDHKVFEKMHSPHAKKKLKDSMKEAEEKRSRGAGGGMAAFAPLFLLPLAAAGVPGLEFLGAGALTPVLQLAAALGLGAAVLGNIDRQDEPDVRAKIVIAQGLQETQRGMVYAHLAVGTPREVADAVARELGGEVRATMNGLAGPAFEVRVDARDAMGAARKAFSAARHDEVRSVAVHRMAGQVLRIDQRNAAARQAAAEQAGREAAPAVPSKITAGDAPDETGAGVVWTQFPPGTRETEARALFAELGLEPGRYFDAGSGYRFQLELAGAETAAAAARRLAASELVSGVEVHPAAFARLRGAEGESSGPKWTRNGTMSSEREFWINVGTPQRLPSEAEKTDFLARHGIFDGTRLLVQHWEWVNGYRLSVITDGWPQAERIIRAANQDAAVTSISVHPDALNRLTLSDAAGEEEAAPETAPEPPAAKTMPAKVSEDAALGERKTVQIVFAESASAKDKKDFIEMHVRNRALRYRLEGNTLHVLLREMRFGPALAEAVEADKDLAAMKVSAAGKQALDEYLASQPELFDHSVANEQTHSELQGADEARGVLVQAREGASPDDLKAWAERYRLKPVEENYRGMAGLHLFEAADSEDPGWAVSALAASLTPESPVVSVRPLSEAAAAPAAAPAPEAKPEPAAAAGPQRRDAQAAWLNFLQTQTLADGKSTLTPKQAGLIAAFLKPVVPPAGQKKHPVIGRVKETKTVIPILTAPRGMINSAMLVGPAGTGKTAIYEGLAQLIEDAENQDAVKVEGEDGSAWLDIRRLRGRWFVQLDIDRLLAEDEPIKVLLALLDLLPLLNSADPRDGNRLIILADEIQKLRMDPQGVKIMNALKGPIRDGQISIAGTTTEKEWKEYFDSDDALKSRFEKLNIDEPSVEETQEMLHGAKSYYEWKHDAEISDEALDAAAKLSDQFDKENHNPRKSVKLVEQAAELARPDNMRAALALDIREGWRKLGVLVASAAKDLVKKGIPSAIALPVEAYNRIAELVGAVTQAYEEQGKVEDGKGVVDIDRIKRTLAHKTGISAGQLTLGEEDASRYVNMEGEVSKRVVNQDRAIRALANAIRRNKSGLSNPHRPMGKFLFVGPTGTGKTHLVKELARFLFKDPDAYVRFDMSEFMEEHTYMRLVGAPPSYVGFGAGGQLTEAVRKRPYSVILLDEVEKAHPKVWDVFLQILDDGRLTDSEGRTVDFKNTVIIMTSNVGMAAVDSQKYERMLTKVWEELKGLEEAEDPAAVAAKVEKGVDLLRASRDAELAAIQARYAKTLADIETAEGEATDLGQILKAKQLKDGLKAKLDADLEAASAKHERLIDARRTELMAKLGGHDREARKAELAKAAEEIEKAWDAEIALAISEGIMSRFRPEFINRLDEDPDSKNKWVIFNRLKRENISLIAKLQVKEFVDLLRERHDTELEIGDDVMRLLVEQGFSPLYGARPMTAAIEKYIIDPLAKWVLDMAQKGESAAARKIKVSVEGGTTRFEMLPKPEKVVEKKTLEGAAQALTREVMELVERRAAASLGQGPAAPEPSEALFDGLLKKASGKDAAPAAAKAAPVFNPGTAYPGAKGTEVAAEHNVAAKKDKAMRAAIEDAVARAKQAGAAPETVDALQPEAGQPGEGWLKQFVRHAKTEAAKARAEAPVTVSYETAGGLLRAKVHSAHRMGEAEAEALRVHFTGPAPKDLKAAQQQADGVNMTASVLRDHNLLDIYRRLSAIPGARFGYRTGAEGTDYWIELPLRGSLPVSGSEASSVASEPRLTPHQQRERAKTKELLLKTLLSKADDGPNIKVAAATGWAWLATREDLATVRAWVLEKGWADRDSTGSRLTDSWPLLMAMALVMKRYGEPSDAPALERILRLYTSSSHFHIPAKMALIDAVGHVLARAGRERARAAYEAAKEAGYSQNQLKEAAQVALGKAGTAADRDAVSDEEFKEVNPDAAVELLEREEPGRLRAFFESHWPPQPDDKGKLSGAPFKGWDQKTKILILKLVGRGYGRPERDLALLKEVLNGTLNSDRVTHYHAAEAYAQMAARLNLGRNLQRQLEQFLERHDMTSYDDKWPVLMGLLYTAQKVGGPELLGALEHAMRQDAGRVSSNYEQPFFELPITWAKIVVRNGLFSRLAQPEPNADGTPGLSKLQKMLTSKEPMLAAAALYAVALEQQRQGGRGQEPDAEPRPDGPEPGDLPDLYVPGSSSGSSGGGWGGGHYFQGDFSDLGPDGTFHHAGWRRWHPANRMPPLP